jgi:protein TonB
MRDRRIHIAIPMALTLLIHVALGSGLFAAGKLIDRTKGPDIIEIEMLPPKPPPAKKKAAAKPPPPKIVEEKPPEPVVDEKVEPPPKEQKVRRTTPRQPRVAVTPPTDEPAPGENTNDDVPAPVAAVDMGADFMNPAAGVPVENRKPTGRNVGTGGSGTNTGGGGKDDSKTKAPPPPPPPVSVASIKTQAKPIGNTDYFNAGKDYPPDAKRLGIEGKVKVKLTVDDKGKVIKRVLVTRLGHGLDKLALKLAKKLKFKPAIDTNDDPVTSVLVWTFNFKLPK